MDGPFCVGGSLGRAPGLTGSGPLLVARVACAARRWASLQTVGFCCRPVLAQEWRSLRSGAVFAAIRLADDRTHGAWGLGHGSACAGCRGSLVRSRAVGVDGADFSWAELVVADRSRRLVA